MRSVGTEEGTWSCVDARLAFMLHKLFGPFKLSLVDSICSMVSSATHLLPYFFINLQQKKKTRRRPDTNIMPL